AGLAIYPRAGAGGCSLQVRLPLRGRRGPPRGSLRRTRRAVPDLRGVMPAGGGLWRGPRGHRPGHHGGAGLGRLWPAPHHAAAARGAVALALLLLALAATPTCGAA
ncbi:hypothetical protein EG858_15905, partial [Enterococcus faecalis]